MLRIAFAALFARGDRGDMRGAARIGESERLRPREIREKQKADAPILNVILHTAHDTESSRTGLNRL